MKKNDAFLSPKKSEQSKIDASQRIGFFVLRLVIICGVLYGGHLILSWEPEADGSQANPLRMPTESGLTKQSPSGALDFTASSSIKMRIKQVSFVVVDTPNSWQVIPTNGRHRTTQKPISIPKPAGGKSSFPSGPFFTLSDKPSIKNGYHLLSNLPLNLYIPGAGWLQFNALRIIFISEEHE